MTINLREPLRYRAASGRHTTPWAHTGFLCPAPGVGRLGSMETPARPGWLGRAHACPLSPDDGRALALSPGGGVCRAIGADVSRALVCRVSPGGYSEPEVFAGFPFVSRRGRVPPVPPGPVPRAAPAAGCYGHWQSNRPIRRPGLQTHSHESELCIQERCDGESHLLHQR